jgi:hypothetical protein
MTGAFLAWLCMKKARNFIWYLIDMCNFQDMQMSTRGCIL